MLSIFLHIKSIAIRLAIKISHWLYEEFGLIETGLYKKLPYQSQVHITLPFSKRKVQLSAAGEISKVIYTNGLLGYEGLSTYLWSKLCKQADLILDIGAHIGLYSILAADTMTDVPIHAFEPLPDIFLILSRNIECSGYKSAICAHPFALSNITGMTKMVIKGSSGSTLEQNFWQDTPTLSQTTIKVDTLDSWMNHAGILVTSKSLIKIDVETHEPAVFDGGKQALAAGPTILCEVLGTFTEHRLSDLLPASNWRYFWIGPDGPVERRQIIGDPGWKFANYLFMPKDSPFEEAIEKYKHE